MNIPATDLPAVCLNPGRFYIADSPTLVTTVLGSCVSVTMFSPRLKVGAICHGLLPRCREDSLCAEACMNGFRYVACSIRLMLKKCSEYGLGNNELEVKLFGGADMFPPEDRVCGLNAVGRLNIQSALRILEAENMKILKSDTGGIQGRKILFYTHTGVVMLKRVRRTETQHL